MSLCHTYLGFFWVSKMTLHMNYEISMTSSDYLCDTLPPPPSHTTKDMEHVTVVTSTGYYYGLSAGTSHLTPHIIRRSARTNTGLV